MAKIIPDDLVQAIINYFGTRPYNEVCLIMPILQTLPDAPEGVPTLQENK